MSNPPDSIARFAQFGFVLALVSSIGQTFFVGLFGGEVQAALDIDAGRWGLLYGVATVASGGLMFWAGAQSDRRPLQWVMAAALGLLATGSVLMALADSVWLLLLGLFALRFGGQGLCGHLAMVVAARPSRQRGRSLSIAAFGFIAGEAVLPISVLMLLGWVEWRELWWLAAVLAVGVVLPLGWWLAGRIPERESMAGADGESVLLLDRRQLLRTPAFRVALSVLLISPFVVTALFLQQASIVSIRGWAPGLFALGFIAFGASQALSNWLGGALVDRFGARALLGLYPLPLAVACLALAFLPGPAALWVLFVGLGATAGVQGVVGGALWVDLFGLRQLGLVRGVYFGFMVLATAVSPFLLGAALSAGVPLQVLGSAAAAYAVLVPWWASRRLQARSVRGAA